MLSNRVSDDALLHALALVTSPVFGSLSVAHGLAGASSEPWRVIESFTYRQIADEIAERGLCLDGLKTSCSDVLVVDSPVTHWMFEYDPRPRCPLLLPPALRRPSRRVHAVVRAQPADLPPAGVAVDEGHRDGRGRGHVLAESPAERR